MPKASSRFPRSSHCCSRSRWRSEGAYAGDAQAYPIDLPDLVKPRVKVEDDRIYVWTAQA